MQKSVGHTVYSSELISVCQILQVCLPLSYAAHISTTPNPDLANVRLEIITDLGSVNQNVRQCSARFSANVCLSSCLREKRCSARNFLGEDVLLYVCDLVVLAVRVRGREWQLVLARTDNACVDQHSPSSKLYRSRALLMKWLLCWQHKSSEMEIFCLNFRLRLPKKKIIYTVVALLK